MTSVDLSKAELDEVEQVQKALLQLPRALSHNKVRDVVARIGKLVGSERAFASYMFDRSLHFIEHNIGPQISDLLRRDLRGVDQDGYFLFNDPALEAINRMRRESGSGVTHERELVDRSVLEAQPFYRDAFVPAGVTHVIGMHARLPVGEAVFAFSYDGEEDPGFSDPGNEARLRILLPAFEEAFRQLYERSADRTRIETVLARIPVPAGQVDSDGRWIVRNAAAQSAFPGEVVEEAALSDAHGLPGPLLETGSTSRLLIWPDRIDGPGVLEAHGRAAGLTERQAEVAALVAQGLTDRQLAAKLDISPHTARRHVEAVMNQLDISSRSSTLWALLSSTAD